MTLAGTRSRRDQPDREALGCREAAPYSSTALRFTGTAWIWPTRTQPHTPGTTCLSSSRSPTESRYERVSHEQRAADEEPERGQPPDPGAMVRRTGNKKYDHENDTDETEPGGPSELHAPKGSRYGRDRRTLREERRTQSATRRLYRLLRRGYSDAPVRPNEEVRWLHR